MKRLVFGLATTVAAMAAAPAANAAVLLTFGQVGQGSPITATATSSSTTTISATNAAIDITQLFGSAATSTAAFLNLTANSSGAASSPLPGFVQQQFGGSFTITSGTGGTGTNYLSGTFAGATFGTGGAATLSGSTPGFSVTLSSSVFGPILPERAVSFSFANVNPSLGICGTTICSFTSSVSGTFSGGVPEPATWGLMILGFGAVGYAMRRRPRASVRFA